MNSAVYMDPSCELDTPLDNCSHANHRCNPWYPETIFSSNHSLIYPLTTQSKRCLTSGWSLPPGLTSTITFSGLKLSGS